MESREKATSLCLNTWPESGPSGLCAGGTRPVLSLGPNHLLVLSSRPGQADAGLRGEGHCARQGSHAELLEQRRAVRTARTRSPVPGQASVWLCSVRFHPVLLIHPSDVSLDPAGRGTGVAAPSATAAVGSASVRAHRPRGCPPWGWSRNRAAVSVFPGLERVVISSCPYRDSPAQLPQEGGPLSREIFQKSSQKHTPTLLGPLVDGRAENKQTCVSKNGTRCFHTQHSITALSRVSRVHTQFLGTVTSVFRGMLGRRAQAELLPRVLGATWTRPCLHRSLISG